MYLQHFALHAKPFELLPDPSFLFPSAVHKKALAYLEYGLQEHSGFILLTGEVGAGKTTLIRSLLRKLPGRVTMAKVFNTRVNAEQLIRLINDDFGLPHSGGDKAAMLRDLNAFLIEQYAAGRRSVLIIDEAQNLGPDLLEEIRLLSNLETDHAKLLQIILVGQPELRDRLCSPELIQLRQRILVHCHLLPLSAEESAGYILHRLELAGNRDAVAWLPGSLEIVHAAARGIPRLINILCDYILLDAFTSGGREISAQQLRDLLVHLDFEAQFWPEARPAEENHPRREADDAELAALQLKIEVLMTAVAGLGQRQESFEKSAAGQRRELAALRAGLGHVEKILLCLMKGLGMPPPDLAGIQSAGQTHARQNGTQNGTGFSPFVSGGG